MLSFPEVPVFPSLNQFPVYVSYPSFFPTSSAIDGANDAIFGSDDSDRNCR